MTIVNVNSFSGINSITAQNTSVTFYNSSGGLADVVGNFNLSPSYATYSEIVGVNTAGSTTSGSTTVILSGSGEAANISNGFSVAGRGITPGTIVSSGGGTTNLVLSQNAGITSTTNPLTFYTNSKVVSPGGVGGMLCRAWVNFDGSSAVSKIRASYNVSSITDEANGTYTANFTVAMPDINYSTSGNFGEQNTAAISAERPGSIQITSMTVSNIRFAPIVCTGSANTDPLLFSAPYIHLSVFR